MLTKSLGELVVRLILLTKKKKRSKPILNFADQVVSILALPKIVHRNNESKHSKRCQGSKSVSLILICKWLQIFLYCIRAFIASISTFRFFLQCASVTRDNPWANAFVVGIFEQKLIGGSSNRQIWTCPWWETTIDCKLVFSISTFPGCLHQNN